MTPEQMRDALAVVDMLDGIDNIRKNADGCLSKEIEWRFSSLARGSSVSVRLDTAAAEFVLSCTVAELKAKYATLGGTFPE